MAKLIALIAVAGLWSCTRVQDEFVVRDPGGVVRFAELRLFGERHQLVQSMGQYRTLLPIKHDADGIILVTLVNERTTSCIVGYVTPGTGSYWEYEIRDGKCVDTEYRARNPRKKHTIFNQYYE